MLLSVLIGYAEKLVESFKYQLRVDKLFIALN